MWTDGEFNFGGQEKEDKRTPGEKARDEGIWVVAGNNKEWMDVKKAEFPVWLAGKPVNFEFSFEHFRMAMMANGSLSPTHPNAWGALGNSLGATYKKAGYIEDTGRYQKSESPSSHAHPTRVYRKLPPP